MKTHELLCTLCILSMICLFSQVCLVYGADTPRFTRMAAIGSMQISGGGYIITEDDGVPYRAPLPNELYNDYCRRVADVSREEFRLRKMAADYAFLLSPSRGSITEILQVMHAGDEGTDCYHAAPLEEVRLNKIGEMLEECFYSLKDHGSQRASMGQLLPEYITTLAGP